MRRIAPFLFFFAVPAFAFAQAPGNFRELVGIFLDVIGLLVPAIFALTFIVIAWGITKAWILRAGSEDDIKKGKDLVFVGVFALIVMSGLWGILAILRAGFFGN